MAESQEETLILVDAHVHVYDCYDVAALLDAAHRNFSTEAQRHRMDDMFQGTLLLAETSRDNWYHSVIDGGHNLAFGSWRFSPSDSDRHSLRAQRKTGESLVLIPGRQIVTSEGIEVLALLTDQLFKDGGMVEDILDQIQESGALPVLPWGVGKWLGSRGAIVTRILQKKSNSCFFLGDNGGRPFGWPEPTQLKEAAEAGIKVLPGSDPLPLPREASRVGSFGFGIRAALSSEPAANLKEHLQNPGTEIFPYGRLARPIRFLRNQLGIRVRRGK